MTIAMWLKINTRDDDDDYNYYSDYMDILRFGDGILTFRFQIDDYYHDDFYNYYYNYYDDFWDDDRPPVPTPAPTIDYY